MRTAIIGGTGVYSLGQAQERRVETEYGDVTLDMVKIGGEEIAFLARHGKGHSVPPHLINYRANIKALEQLGVKYVFATCAVGSCNEAFAPGDVVVIRDFLDFTKARPVTFFDGGDRGVAHIAMDNPYCPNLRRAFSAAAQKVGLEISGDGVYVCTEGPRFETRQEIKMFKHLGGDVVGMTNVPEVVLAKELGMCYAAVGIITNWCTGLGNDLAHHDIRGTMEPKKDLLTQAFISVFTEAELDQDHCNCNNSMVGLE